MRRFLAATVLLTGIAAFSLPANAGGYGYKYRGHGHGHGGAYVAAGIIGGAILLGALLSRPRYYYPPPAPVYYGPPRAPVCTREDVYRYLPDGRIQWGVRTRCY